MTIRIDPDGIPWDDSVVRFYDLNTHVYDRITGKLVDYAPFIAWAESQSYTLDSTNFDTPPADGTSLPPFGVVDTTPPVLGDHTVTSDAPGSMTGSIICDDGSGVLVAIVTALDTPPTTEQIASGLDAAGAPAAAVQRADMTAAGPLDLAASGLTDGASYYSHVAQANKNGYYSLVSTAGPFVVASAGAGDEGGVLSKFEVKPKPKPAPAPKEPVKDAVKAAAAVKADDKPQPKEPSDDNPN